MTVCPVCQMCYVAGLPDNEKEHRRYHDCVVNGVPARPLKTDQLIWQEKDRRITLVHARSPKAQRKRAEEAARFANRETRYDCGIYHQDTHIFLYHVGERIAGLISLERKRSIWRCQWLEDATFDCQKLDGHEAMWSIIFVGVLKKLRKQGVATQLLKEALLYLGVQHKEVGYCTPFSEDGQEFVRRFNPIDFFVAK